MEEKSTSAVLHLLFRSNQIHQLEVHLCDPEETILRTITLWNYQEGTLSFFPDHLHYYCVIYEKNSNSHIVELPMPQDCSGLQKNVDFETFSFKVGVSFPDQPESTANEEIAQYRSMAKLHYQSIANKVIEQLEKENYIKKDPESTMMRAFVRKPKGKKNFTDIFMMNRRGEIKGMARTSTNNINKFKHLQTPIIQEHEQNSLPSIPKLVKMNTSIEDLSKRLSFMDVDQSQKGTNIFIMKGKNSENCWEEPKKKEPRVVEPEGRRVLYRKMFVKTLERQTTQQLNFQKETLSFLKQFNEKEGIGSQTGEVKKSRVKKNKVGIVNIYSKSRLRY